MSRIILGAICGLIYGDLSAASMIPLSFPDVLRNAGNYHPEFVLKVCADWAKGKNSDTKWIIKDALRKLKTSRPKEVAKIFASGT